MLLINSDTEGGHDDGINIYVPSAGRGVGASGTGDGKIQEM
jgi:hypothetical protein